MLVSLGGVFMSVVVTKHEFLQGLSGWVVKGN